MCTLVAGWMWVPRQQDLTVMGTNGCHSAAPGCSQTALFVLANHRKPFKSGATAAAAGLTKLSSDEYRRSVLFCFSSPVSFLSFVCCQVEFGACKWHNHVHISLSVLCICITIQRGKKTVVFQYNLFIFKSRMMRHL